MQTNQIMYRSEDDNREMVVHYLYEEDIDDYDDADEYGATTEPHHIAPRMISPEKISDENYVPKRIASSPSHSPMYTNSTFQAVPQWKIVDSLEDILQQLDQLTGDVANYRLKLDESSIRYHHLQSNTVRLVISSREKLLKSKVFNGWRMLANESKKARELRNSREESVHESNHSPNSLESPNDNPSSDATPNPEESGSTMDSSQGNVTPKRTGNRPRKTPQSSYAAFSPINGPNILRSPPKSMDQIVNGVKAGVSRHEHYGQMAVLQKRIAKLETEERKWRQLAQEYESRFGIVSVSRENSFAE